MEQDFYKLTIQSNGIDVMIPNEKDREQINRIIYDELCLGIVSEKSKSIYQRIIEDLVEQGAEGIILGCTEIGLLIKKDDCNVPIFDTTLIHALEAVHKSLSEC